MKSLLGSARSWHRMRSRPVADIYEVSGTVASYLYYTNNMKAIELVSGAPTSLIWDGTDYLQGGS
jgi:hypothetical protein